MLSGLLVALCLVAGVLLLLPMLRSSDDQSSGGQSIDANAAEADTRDAVTVEDDAEADVPTQDKVDFTREVLPILSDHCLLCHGPDRDSEEAQAAGFRLDLREEAVGSEMIVPGDPAASLFIDVLTTKKASQRMPPLDSGKKQLTPKQVDILTRWIAQGAEYTDR